MNADIVRFIVFVPLSSTLVGFTTRDFRPMLSE
jgi:hypothetical protein